MSIVIVNELNKKYVTTIKIFVYISVIITSNIKNKNKTKLINF